MALFKCNNCNVIQNRDLRELGNKMMRGKKRFKSYCHTVGRNVYMAKIKTPTKQQRLKAKDVY